MAQGGQLVSVPPCLALGRFKSGGLELSQTAFIHMSGG